MKYLGLSFTVVCFLFFGSCNPIDFIGQKILEGAQTDYSKHVSDIDVEISVSQEGSRVEYFPRFFLTSVDPDALSRLGVHVDHADIAGAGILDPAEGHLLSVLWDGVEISSTFFMIPPVLRDATLSEPFTDWLRHGNSFLDVSWKPDILPEYDRTYASPWYTVCLQLLIKPKYGPNTTEAYLAESASGNESSIAYYETDAFAVGDTAFLNLYAKTFTSSSTYETGNVSIVALSRATPWEARK